MIDVDVDDLGKIVLHWMHISSGRVDSKVGCGLGIHDIDQLVWSCVEYDVTLLVLLEAIERRSPDISLQDIAFLNLTEQKN